MRHSFVTFIRVKIDFSKIFILKSLTKLNRIMKLELYNHIMASIRQYQGLSKDCAEMLKKTYPSVPEITLNSILSLEIQHRMTVNHIKLFGSNKDHYHSYVDAVKAGEPTGILLRMAKELQAQPALLARHVVAKYCEIYGSSVLRHDVNKLLKDTTLIENRDLAYEIFLCVLYDDFYGPIATATAIAVGQEYELKLHNCLMEKNLPFYNEEYLRSRGYDKTPDVKLEIPIAVNGYVINWIESKARFGNPEIHQKYIKDQFLSYWNRFGPGLVIYWHGFVDTLREPGEERFLIMDDFPESITCMDPTII